MRRILLILIGLNTFGFAELSRSAAGVVSDSETLLQWQDDTTGSTMTWSAAITYCEELGLDGGGWRLPNLNELTSIVDDTRYIPAVDNSTGDGFQHTASDSYWSSTTRASDTSDAWIVTFYNGAQGSYPKDASTNVRCVRAGQFDSLPFATIGFVGENPQDDTVQRSTFTKQWQFDSSLNGYSVEVVSSDYASYGSATIDNKSISMSLTPNTTNPVNKIILKLKDASGQYVNISGSPTFWATTKTNHAPRLADGQITQLLSATNEPAFVEVESYDGDGDTVTLSIEDDAGGYVGFDPDNPKRVFASFSDGNVSHTIKIGLDDGKEKVIKEFNVLQFNGTSIDTFYSDVDKSASEYIYDGIAFGTLKGVVWGQPDPNDATKRIFRPTDPASLAEALKIIINAEQKAGLVKLKTAEYYRKAYPSWVMPYYTFAVDSGALSSESTSLTTVYPTREDIAKLIVKTLNLDKKIYYMDNNVSFTDDADFSDDNMRTYGHVAKAFGLFMTGTQAKPQETISRAELAMVIEKIFMIPSATLNVTPASIEYGENITATLSDKHAESINPSTYALYDASSNLQATYIANGVKVTNPIDSHILPSTVRSLYAILDNDGVKNIVTAPINMHYTDTDNDGIQNAVDKWTSDIRYAYDDNNNGIPDILDDIYNLGGKTASETALLDGYTVNIADIIRDGGWFAPDLDGDGISDNLDPDIDGDSVVNQQDAFPRDASEWLDTDHDGIGNNADTDDDNDGISDKDEVKWGFDPLDPNDGGSADTDGDGVSNADEIKAGSNPLDPNDTKKPKRFAPIMMDDMVIIVPLVN